MKRSSSSSKAKPQKSSKLFIKRISQSKSTDLRMERRDKIIENV